MKSTQLLDNAKSLQTERGKQYDTESERSHKKTAESVNAIKGYSLTGADIFLILTVLKLVRSESQAKPHKDSIEDLVSYSSLYGEARIKGE